MRVNAVTMVLVGLAVWVVALVVVLILDARGMEVRDGLHICLAGIGFGLAALAWAIPVQRRSAARAAEPARHGGRDAADPAGSTDPAGPADD